ncbi:MAG: alkaline phosphatase family protein [Gemmatimonadetes bacterium]|nr:alkaline phosphatase family protein [Gemmatimonadota bacterium]
MVTPPEGITRVVLVVIDGVRADAVPLFGMPHLERLMARGAWSIAARTVTPSVTAAAMGSLLTGVEPTTHGLASDRFCWPRPTAPLDPLPRVLGRAGVPSHAHLATVPRAYRKLAEGFARLVGITHATLRGDAAREIVAAAEAGGRVRQAGLHLHHWPDADRAGHAEGWTSRAYAAALREIDAALGALVQLTEADGDDETLFLVLADHGGGGTDFRNHDSAHPHDRRIPLVLAGPQVQPGRLADGYSLLDVPATVAWALGADVPEGWHGRPITEAFATLPDVATTAMAIAC